ncbi:MAG: hypothetical protein H7A24_06855 [Leptospiraceae bacterium]|nr:hypothetical protein [Leptospiraceae bacterium]MCP5511582.1 hypothetical protein [Leptospiraceae bacterium]
MEEPLIPKTRLELYKDLSVFLEVYHKTKILELREDTIRMYILFSKSKNKTPKEKLINYKLLRIDERLFPESKGELTVRDAIVCEFLIDELKKYFAKSISEKSSE